MRVLNLLVFGAAVALSGCSLSLQFDCTDDSDCANLTGTFMCNGTTCVEVIEPDVMPDMTPEPEGFSCADDEPLLNDETCIDILGPLPTSPGASSAARSAVFVEQADDFELIAVQLPNGNFAGVGNEQTIRVLHHTVDHINKAGGLTYGDPEESKKLAVLVCYDALGDGNVSGGVAAANHAVGCGAKALVSTYLSDRTLEIFREVAVPNEVPMIAPGAISPEIPIVRGALGNTGFLWRIKVPGTTLLESVMGLIDELGYQKVHLVYREESLYDAAMYRQLQPRLGDRLKGSLNLNGGTAGSSPGTVETYLSNLADDSPDLVVSLVGELGDLLDQAVGGINAARENDGLVFDFITVEGARSTDAADIVATQTEHQKLSCRTMGISSGIKNGDTTGGWRFAIDRDREDYDLSAEDLDTLPAPTLGYVDGVVVTAYAVASALRRNGGVATTEYIVDGLKLLSDPGEEVVVPLQWSAGLTALGANGRGQMNYEGVSGSIDLVTETQDVSGRKTELWQYDFGDDLTGTVVELGDLVDDDAADFTPNAAAIDALRNAHMQRAQCADFPYLLGPHMPAE